MDLRIFPNSTNIQSFYVHGFTVITGSDVLVSREHLKFTPLEFSEPVIFSSEKSAIHFIDDNNLASSFVVKVFDFLGCRGYSELSNEDQYLKDLMLKEKEYLQEISNFELID